MIVYNKGLFMCCPPNFLFVAKTNGRSYPIMFLFNVFKIVPPYVRAWCAVADDVYE